MKQFAMDCASTQIDEEVFQRFYISDFSNIKIVYSPMFNKDSKTEYLNVLSHTIKSS